MKGVFVEKEESKVIEFKLEMIPDIENWIIAFLNTKGGIIYIGVSDDGKIIGVPQDKKNEYDLKIGSILDDVIKPNLRKYVDYYFDDNNVQVIKIKKGDFKPYYIAGKGPRPYGVYIRAGRSTRSAKEDEIIDMLLETNGYLFEEDVSPNQELHFNKLKIYADDKQLNISESKYKTLRIKNKEGKFTNLGLLVSDENPYIIKFAVYDNKFDFLVKKEFKGSIIYIADQVLEYAKTFNVTSAKIIPGISQRIETISYPGVSIREAILNAIIHAEYRYPSNIKIEFYKAFLKITNPGCIFNSSLEDALEGVQTFRNPGLVNIFMRLDFIENYGTGLKRINEAYKDKEIKPVFKDLDRYFIVELPNLNYVKEVDEPINEPINEPVNEPINSKALIVFDCLIKNNHLTKEKLCNLTGFSRPTITRSLQSLQKEGKIKRVGSPKSGHWEIIDKIDYGAKK